MIRLVALDLVLRILLARMVDVSFVIHILPVNFHNPAADVPGLGVPGHVIADFDLLAMLHLPDFRSAEQK